MSCGFVPGASGPVRPAALRGATCARRDSPLSRCKRGQKGGLITVMKSASESDTRGSAVTGTVAEPTKELTDQDRAEATRRALAQSSPQVSFRKKRVDLARDPAGEGFSYSSGVSKGVDVWLISALLCFLVPAVFLAIFVANGTIDLTPR
mmetsp:Transcript_14515/g.31175  ORF Transcript_14515/g.31175 Transcript_14515/m.31175 type:complete len:150 (+) Transcript_14515:264-713(+)|eukprot:CAMPEP_0185851756 /NCGR_PEP_ID=MMETSP1354-20130828/11445_1 /TAXON_ID=708628 /ORGANISM="Erythrolobus madagascarensis, Strain CCMP3276" /LENGTH=149 /DNA_ID=CAMNT_0028552813 /DNA_START=202 /DNA_END=651 /DNA_ORIENTATION=-